MARELCIMSWAYWGIITGLLTLVVLLLVCMDILSTKSITSRSTATQAGGEASAGRTQPTTTNQRAA